MKKLLALLTAVLAITAVTGCSKTESDEPAQAVVSSSDRLSSNFELDWDHAYFGINESNRAALGVDGGWFMYINEDKMTMCRGYVEGESGKLMAEGTEDEEIATYKVVDGKLEFTVNGDTVVFDKVDEDRYASYAQLLSTEMGGGEYLPGGDPGDGNYEPEQPSEESSDAEESSEPASEQGEIPLEDLDPEYIDKVAMQSYEMQNEDGDIHLIVYTEGDITTVSVEIMGDYGFGSVFYFASLPRLQKYGGSDYMFSAQLKESSASSDGVFVYWSVPTGGLGKIKIVSSDGSVSVEKDDLAVVGA